ncbi:heterokaryon incompatibility protein-domain-containing protein, partial [Halenospora varia]
YMCLSHCWGTDKFLITTTKNLSDHKQRIPWDSLPTTFQHAIGFTRRLGVRYIWIDSLCIVQDDLKDWQRESSQMCTVYKNSFLTLAASAASSSLKGLFQYTTSTPILSLPVRFYTNLPEIISLRKAIQHPFIDTPFKKVTDRFPLLGQAWVYQERLLSPRTLHFGQGELIWECSTQTVCECNSLHVEGTYHTATLLRPSSSDLAARGLAIVTDYSRLSITFMSDRLSALVGIAQQFAEHRKSRYLAGLWEETFAGDMLWELNEFYPNSKRVAQATRAPSWSWVSTEHQVFYPDGTAESVLDFKVLEVQVSRDDTNEFGHVGSSHVKLCGRLTEM